MEWMDMTFRVPAGSTVEVDRLPAGEVELSIKLPGDNGRLTLLIEPGLARAAGHALVGEEVAP